MPSIKMKAKSTTSCPREKNGLHICQKSSVIYKNPLSQVKIAQNGELVDFIQNHHDVSFCSRAFLDDIREDRAQGDELHNAEDPPLEKKQLPLSDSATLSSMDSIPTTCTSSMETIFSPILESIDVHNESNVPSDGGSNDLYLPLLETEDSDSSGSSCEHHTCNVSDFYISDMIVSGLPTDDGLTYDDGSATMFFSDYKCEEPNMLTNMSEEYMVFPFLEHTAEAGHDNDNRTCRENITDSDQSSLYLAIHQLRSSDQESAVFTHSESDQSDCFDPHMYIRNMPDGPDVAKPAIVPNRLETKKPVTLVLDLDETLVHSTLEECDNADFTFPVFFNMKEHIVYVRQRPHLRSFLERVSDLFEIVIFTASQSIYAKQLLDILDPDGKYISRRAYRESCIFSDGSYTKDLTVLGVDLAKVVIIDNSPQVFRLQVNNGIPIKSWFDDPSDSALISLLPFLEILADADDVRPIIAEKFGQMEIPNVLATKWTSIRSRENSIHGRCFGIIAFPATFSRSMYLLYV
ncbi:CTD small phosphatase-like protein 2 isoform X1 [Ipomoea triloba]|uniref:CTD small phosphatase-like protein 2 isoform X1 n=1 Tax=Ipomoea triloba TaxID=35885 RepID=UPI00125D15A2|nr:CTD small phosphatase-like protein 2 isoform X1 [Ipomoea triloba]XP_031129414.1 CTD small phosphatase-like protein 2 isoform X1 [Ipomoea triloba]